MTIRNMHDAVQAIGRAVGINDLAPNSSGAFELVFVKQLQVYFQVVSDTEIEVQLRMGEGGPRLAADALSAMLAANLDLRRGRLAIEPGTDRVVYCGRVDIAQHDGPSLIAAIKAIIQEGAAWKLEHFETLLGDVAARNSTSSVLSETLIRV